ncbi:MAG TPA: ABC transporter ATP-binding protein, partial [Prolixibacteraceae bacterium]|nr:ABC transporter ATP-binding protein [Prolixibacteraceae bacterium]
MSNQSTIDRIDKKDVLFYIEKLSCAYVSDQPVLEAKNLYIPKRKITVLLGPSGAGKSTLLETLGLMTQTVNGESSSIMFYPTDTDEYNLAEMWDDTQEEERYKVRMLYYSFIFQSTNLMPNFTALENVGLTELIQNKPESEAYFNAIESLVKNLSVTSLSYDKKPFEFSGGERQRLAFARAINPEFTVLFGDEPTGNLDHFNSVKLMHFIRDFITKQRDNVSAIIVSHNIPLTLDFADRIIVLSKGDNDVATIDPHFIYDREQLKWDQSRELNHRIQEEIELLLNSDTESFVRILIHLSENEVEEDFFQEIKQAMVSHKHEMDEDSDFSEEKKKSFKLWLTSKLSDKELLNSDIKENISQFAYGEIKKADIKINDVIRTIQDLKFKTAVEGQRDDRRPGSISNLEQQELGRSRSPFASIVGFIPWLVFSIAPLFTFLIQNASSALSKLISRVYRPVKEKVSDEDDEFASLKDFFSIRNITAKTFYKLCIAWDWVNVKYKLFAKIRLKQDWISFSAIPHDFKHLFYRNETKELLGKRNKNFWLIVSILFFTFLAIGFSNGSLEYLKDKMEDPFVRSLNAPIPGINRQADRVIDLYNSDSLQQFYDYDTIVGYNKWTAYFQGNMPESPNSGVEGRSIPFDDPLVNTIVDPDINDAIGSPFSAKEDVSIIVTRKMLNKLECSDDPAFIFKQRDDRLVPIPVRAIVDKLPGERVDFITTQHFYNNYMYLGNNFLFKDNKKLYAYVVMDSTWVPDFKQACDSFFTRYWNEGGLLEANAVDVYKHRYSYKDMYTLQVSFYGSEYVNIDDIDNLFQQLKNSEEIKTLMDKAEIADHQLVQSYFPNQQMLRPRRFDYIAVNFNSLGKVDEFAEKFAADSGIKLEMSKIEQMKNYNFVSQLTRIMSVILIGFSVLMINIFLSNILSTHLNKI